MGWALLEAYDNDPQKAIAAYDANPMAAGDQMIVSWFKQQFHKAWKRLAFTELDFEKMVKIYNGPAQVKQYAPKLKKYYNQLSNISEGNTEAPKTNPPSVSPASKSPPCADSTGAVVTDPPGASAPPGVDPASPPAIGPPPATVGQIGAASGGVRDQTPCLKAALKGDNTSQWSKKKNGLRSGLPCTVWVACWVFNQLGWIPKASQQKNWAAWRRKNKAAFTLINIHSGPMCDTGYPVYPKERLRSETIKPGDSERRKKSKNKEFHERHHKCRGGSYDNIIWIHSKLGGSYTHYTTQQTKKKSKGGLEIAPKLTKDRWHVVQRWYPGPLPKNTYGRYPSGHIFLIWWDGGKKVRKVDDGRVGDFQDKMVSIDRWWKKGNQVTVLTTPYGKQSDEQARATKRVANQCKQLKKESKARIKAGQPG